MTKSNYNKMGKKYISKQQQYIIWKKENTAQFLEKSLGKLNGKKILDIGCGSGTFIRYLASKGADVYGIDISKTMIDEAKNNVGNKVKVADMNAIPFPNKTFDAVISRFSLHYLNSFEKVYAQVHRVLKPHGIFSCVAHHPLADFVINKKYDSKHTTKLVLFDHVKLSFPAHRLTDYFSPGLFKHFTLENYEEGIEVGFKPQKNVPGFVAFTAKKK
jgi:ubiquinone/menaquinone biosynthesis C-methylase UbiE